MKNILFIILIFICSCHTSLKQNTSKKGIKILLGGGFKNDKIDLYINKKQIFEQEDVNSDLSIGIDPNYRIAIYQNKLVVKNFNNSQNTDTYLDTIPINLGREGFNLKLVSNKELLFDDMIFFRNGRYLFLHLNTKNDLVLEYYKKRKLILD